MTAPASLPGRSEGVARVRPVGDAQVAFVVDGELEDGLVRAGGLNRAVTPHNPDSEIQPRPRRRAVARAMSEMANGYSVPGAGV